MIFKYKVLEYVLKNPKRHSVVKAVQDENNNWKINLVYSMIPS